MKKTKQRRSKKTIIVLDLEFVCDKGGMRFRDMEIIRIGAVKWQTGSSEVQRFDAYVKPIRTKTLSAFCKELTGIAQEQVDGAESFEQVYPQLKSWAGGWEHTVLFSWGENDIKRLRIEMDESGHGRDIPVLRSRYQNLQSMFRRITGIDVSVETALALYGRTFEGTKHEPLWDAHNTLRIYQELTKRPNFSKWLQVHAASPYLSSEVQERAAFLMNQLDEQPRVAESQMYQSQLHKVQERLASEVHGMLKKEVKAFRDMMAESGPRRLVRRSAGLKKRYGRLTGHANPLLEKLNIQASLGRIEEWHAQYEAVWRAEQEQTRAAERLHAREKQEAVS